MKQTRKANTRISQGPFLGQVIELQDICPI